MAKDRADKKKEKKEKKRSETDGVHKKSKKEKEDTSRIAEAAEQQLTESSPAEGGAVAVVEEKTVLAPAVEMLDRPVGALVPFANPLAEDKAAKKVLKSVKKAAVNKALKRGVKEVVKSLRKSPIQPANVAVTSPAAIVVIAADISPMDVISHIPVLCEDHGIPYVYVSSRAELGAAGATKRPTSVVMVLQKPGKNKKKDVSKEGEGDEEDYSKVYDELVKVVEKESKKVKV